MTVWLHCQEAVSQFYLYPAQAKPLQSLAIPTAPPEGNKKDSEDNAKVILAKNADASPYYVLAKRPSLPGTSVNKLVHWFGCTDFICALVNFLHLKLSSCTLPVPVQHLSQYTHIAVYKQMHMYLSPLCQVSLMPLKDIIWVIPVQPACGLIQATPAHFDTMLVQETVPDLASHDPLQGV